MTSTTVTVAMAYKYPDQLYKVAEGSQTVTYRKAGCPTRLARTTDYDFWYETVSLDALEKLVANG